MTCKGCLGSVIVSDEVIQELLIEADEDPSLLVTNEIYDSRLKECGSCHALQYGTTCRYGGFIVYYQAKFKHKSCPNPEKIKWGKID